MIRDYTDQQIIEAFRAGSDSLTRLEIKRLRDELEQKDKTLRELERRRFAGKPQIAMQLAPSSPPTFQVLNTNSIKRLKN